jgi:hypothetical protein
MTSCTSENGAACASPCYPDVNWMHRAYSMRLVDIDCPTVYDRASTTAQLNEYILMRTTRENATSHLADLEYTQQGTGEQLQC